MAQSGEEERGGLRGEEREGKRVKKEGKTAEVRRGRKEKNLEATGKRKEARVIKAVDKQESSQATVRVLCSQSGRKQD